MSSTYGENILVSIFGESHGSAVGVTISGIPAGITLDMDRLKSFMERRAPGNSRYSTPRKEGDEPCFISGVVDSVTCGSPITAIIKNNNTKSADYGEIAECPRPGHADFTAHIKYGGHEDYRGGGHFSGRLTAPLCIAGGIFIQILEGKGIRIEAKILEIGGNAETPFEEIDRAKEKGDSVGGIISCEITGLPMGIGEPIFHGLENKIAQAVFGIPAVKGIEFGRGFDSARISGSENNDVFCCEEGKLITETNNHGGILGGISSGMPLTFNVAFKPTPSISLCQNTVNYRGESVELKVKGRHDPCIVPRALPCVESAAAMAIIDLMNIM